MDSTFRVEYKDKPILLIAIPLVTLISYYLTYAEVTLNHFFFSHFCLDLLEAFGGALAGRTIILSLDNLYPFAANISKRIALQVVLTGIAVLSSITLLNEFLRMMILREVVPISYYTHNLLIFFIWVLVFNGLYIGIYFYQYYQFVQKKVKTNLQTREEMTSTSTIPMLKYPNIDFASEEQHATIHDLKESESKKLHKLLTKIGKQEILLDIDEVIGFGVDDEITWAYTSNAKRYPLDYSLDRLEEMIHSEKFFRANRQIIIHLSLVKSITRIENGKLLVYLQPNKYLPETINISRIKAPSFKNWYKGNIVNSVNS
jgi:hypothetical protein